MNSTTQMQWETGEEIEGQVTGRSRSNVGGGQFDGLGGRERAQAVTRRLTLAVDAWWQQGEMPSIGLVRDALLALEAGRPVDEAGRTLLLRGALFYGKGMRTALHHLNDPERAASVMRDMLLHPTQPLAPAQIVALAHQDDDSVGWMAPLLQLLREEMAQPLEPRRTLAQASFEFLREGRMGDSKPASWVALAAQTAPAQSKPRRGRRGFLSGAARRGLASLFGVLALALVVLALAFTWLDIEQSLDPTGDMVSIPSGIYRISATALADTDRLVELQSFSIDRTEVTNRAYRLCYEADGCTWPTRTSSVLRPDYFLNPALDSFPMINVTHAQAALFCRWAGKRLPLEEEWEVAASSALTLQRAYRYPWGDTYESVRANGASTAVGDTLAVGTFSPGGDSPSQVADMAGNVAEWTATPINLPGAPDPGYVAKGGSFQDTAVGLATNSRMAVDGEEGFPWLGFRCAITEPADDLAMGRNYQPFATNSTNFTNDLAKFVGVRAIRGENPASGLVVTTGN